MGVEGVESVGHRCEDLNLSEPTCKRKARVFLSYPPQLRVQKQTEVDALCLGGEGEEARRDTNCDLWLIAAKTELVQRLFSIL